MNDNNMEPIDKIIKIREERIKKIEEELTNLDLSLYEMYEELDYFKQLKERFDE